MSVRERENTGKNTGRQRDVHLCIVGQVLVKVGKRVRVSAQVVVPERRREGKRREGRVRR